MSEPAWVALGSRGGIVDWEGGWSAGVAYVQGDVVRHNGIDYIAVNPSTGQSPAAATPVVGGRTLGYTEFTTSVTVTAHTAAAATEIVAAPALTFDGATPILIECWLPYMTLSVIPGQFAFQLWDGTTDLGALTAPSEHTAASAVGPIHLVRRLTPTAGAHTFAVRGWTTGTATGTVLSGPGGIGQQIPGFIRVSLDVPAALNITTRVSDPGYGTSLPASPVDGEEYTLVDSVTNPSYQWRFRYNAGSSSAYKWEFVGGASVSAYVATLETTATLTYVALTTPGPSVILPRAGDYEIALGCAIDGSSAAGGAMMSFDIGATPATDAERIGTSSFGTATMGTFNVYREQRLNGLAAVTLTAKYKAVTSGTARFILRYLAAKPVRVA